MNARAENRRLFLEAVLAEYKRLTDHMMNHEKNSNYLCAVLVGGVATLLGVSEKIGFVSFLLIPVFISVCGILMLSESYSSAYLAYYIVEEIEYKRLPKLFPRGSPIQYDGLSLSRHGSLSFAFQSALFFMSSFLCVASLIAFTLMWTQVSQSALYQIIYFFGWITVTFYAFSFVVMVRRLLHEFKRIKVLMSGT